MPQEPKKRHSRQRQGKRRSHIALKIKKPAKCPNCNANVLPHTLCGACGWYDGRQIVLVKEKSKKEKPS
ncbi:50S ribosomal protein L32 [Patescibacteria group bacterium]|nr:50S ribosomal protein L32 [Patescibacteria group bacterium]MCL5010339.1 50S ribosomal protein L32 [Patescibacteria group bacterium]